MESQTFVRVLHCGEMVDVEEKHWAQLVQALHGEQAVVHLTMIGGDPIVMRADSIDSIALMTVEGLRARLIHNDTFFGSRGDDAAYQ